MAHTYSTYVYLGLFSVYTLDDLLPSVQMMFPVFVFALMPFCVESPRWLAARGRFDEVAPVLARLEGKGATPTTPSVLAQAKEITEVARYEAEIGSSWKEVTLPKHFHRYRLELADKAQTLSMGELQNFRRLFISGALGVMHQVRPFTFSNDLMCSTGLISLGYWHKRCCLLRSCCVSAGRPCPEACVYT
jgi:Sugar (and other) transporter